MFELSAPKNYFIKTFEFEEVETHLYSRVMTSCCNSPMWPQGGAVGHLRGDRHRRKRPAQFGGVQLLRAEDQRREM